jgi:DNA-binding NarL/FixJ family response regulator
VTDDVVSVHVCILGGPNLWRLGVQALLRSRPNLARVTHASDVAQVVEPPDVLCWAQGLSNKEVAQRLFLSVRTEEVRSCC